MQMKIQQSNAIEALGFTNFMNCIFEERPNRVGWRGLRLGSEIFDHSPFQKKLWLDRDFSLSSGKLHRAQKEAHQIFETILSKLS